MTDSVSAGKSASTSAARTGAARTTAKRAAANRRRALLHERASDVHRLLAEPEPLGRGAVRDDEQVVVGRVDVIDGKVGLDLVTVLAGQAVHERAGEDDLDVLLAQPVPGQKQRQV